MATTFTSLWRLAVLQTADPATNNTWGVVQDATMPLMEQGAVGITSVNIGGLTTYSLTTANNATDQARYLVRQYTGALTANCTVTIPNLQKVGWEQNNTTGGFDVILSAGGTTFTLPPDGVWRFFQCDGATNVNWVSAGFGNMWQTIGNYTLGGASSQAIPLPTQFRRFRLTAQGFTFSNAASMILQVSSNGGVSYYSSNQYQYTGWFTDTSGGTLATEGAAAAFFPVSGLITASSAQAFDATTEIWPGSGSLRPTFRGFSYGFGSDGNFRQGLISGSLDVAAAMNYLLVSPSAGTFSGTLILEGLP